MQSDIEFVCVCVVCMQTYTYLDVMHKRCVHNAYMMHSFIPVWSFALLLFDHHTTYTLHEHS